MLERIDVTVASKHYPIYIGKDLLNQSHLIIQHLSARQIMIVTNSSVAPYYLSKLQAQLHDYQCDTLILPDGEAYKTLETLATIFTHLIEHRHHRDTTLIALGGGVIGDLTGFAAACYMRGVDYLQIPTTLLAQVDAAIGGKTAVNHPQAKNLIGAFYQPNAVIIDVTTLSSLPEREFKAGLAEVIKYGLIADATFFNWLELHIDNILARDPATLTHLIKVCCQIKANLVAQDERDKGLRRLLNLGHTFAHALETGLGYGCYLHGEAVAVGLCLAAEVSQLLSNFPYSDILRIKQLIAKIGLPIALPNTLSIKQLLSLMTNDKKAKLSNLTLILLKSIGLAYCEHNVDYQWLYNYLKCK
ncbi:MAG: aroB [Gammaproteobacteria bacterium]|jgi:3-dehydroquinate synthase|nr:aroB [Gammaproteobacteria bacterium]